MNTLLGDLVSRDAILAELACIVSDPGPVFCNTFQSFQVLQLYRIFETPWLLRGAKQQPLHADTLRIGGIKA